MARRELRIHWNGPKRDDYSRSGVTEDGKLVEVKQLEHCLSKMFIDDKPYFSIACPDLLGFIARCPHAVAFKIVEI